MRQGTRKGEPPKGKIAISVRLSPEDHAAFEGIAAREHRSLSGQVRHWIEERLREEEREAA